MPNQQPTKKKVDLQQNLQELQALLLQSRSIEDASERIAQQSSIFAAFWATYTLLAQRKRTQAELSAQGQNVPADILQIDEAELRRTADAVGAGRVFKALLRDDALREQVIDAAVDTKSDRSTEIVGAMNMATLAAAQAGQRAFAPNPLENRGRAYLLGDLLEKVRGAEPPRAPNAPRNEADARFDEAMEAVSQLREKLAQNQPTDWMDQARAMDAVAMGLSAVLRRPQPGVQARVEGLLRMAAQIGPGTAELREMMSSVNRARGVEGKPDSPNYVTEEYLQPAAPDEKSIGGALRKAAQNAALPSRTPEALETDFATLFILSNLARQDERGAYAPAPNATLMGRQIATHLEYRHYPKQYPDYCAQLERFKNDKAFRDRLLDGLKKDDPHPESLFERTEKALREEERRAQREQRRRDVGGGYAERFEQRDVPTLDPSRLKAPYTRGMAGGFLQEKGVEAATQLSQLGELLKGLGADTPEAVTNLLAGQGETAERVQSMRTELAALLATVYAAEQLASGEGGSLYDSAPDALELEGKVLSLKNDQKFNLTVDRLMKDPKFREEMIADFARGAPDLDKRFSRAVDPERFGERENVRRAGADRLYDELTPEEKKNERERIRKEADAIKADFNPFYRENPNAWVDPMEAQMRIAKSRYLVEKALESGLGLTGEFRRELDAQGISVADFLGEKKHTEEQMQPDADSSLHEDSQKYKELIDAAYQERGMTR